MVIFYLELAIFSTVSELSWKIFTFPFDEITHLMKFIRPPFPPRASHKKLKVRNTQKEGEKKMRRKKERLREKEFREKIKPNRKI